MREAIFKGKKLPQDLEKGSQTGNGRSIPTEKDFEFLFKTHFKALHKYAYSILRDPLQSEEIVQQVFFKVWEKQAHLHIHSSILAYLYKAVYHESLNYMKHHKVKKVHELHVVHSPYLNPEQASGKILKEELTLRIQLALNALPEGCRTVFQLSRSEGMKYAEIAQALGISIKTVESQMGKALKLLRKRLIDFLPLTILLLNSTV